MSGAKVAMAQTHSFQSGALSFMSCTSGRESSPMDESDSHQTTEFKTETKKKRFHPLRNLRRMFRRKTRRSSISADSYQAGVPETSPEILSTNLEQRSCSTSRLQEENLTQNLMRNSRLNPGLSLSHDSIFTPDRADSGLSSSDLENSSLSITVLTPPSKECHMKSQSSCSETSLLSIGSSEVELSPVRSSKISDLDIGVTSYKLSHSAAKHKMAVKPRRNHGVPRSRRKTLTSKSPLPTTLELSEEGATGRSSPPMEISVTDNNTPSSQNCDKRTSEKISWSQITLEHNIHESEEKPQEGEKVQYEMVAEEEEEVANQKAESFFGRFLSRRSEKKKKLLAESEESAEEKPVGHFAKKFSKSSEGKGGAEKPINRRQRMEPVEIPSTDKKENEDLGRSEKDYPPGRRISSSVSPPKSYWPSQVTSRSISPTKVVWSENFSYYVKPVGPTPTVWDKSKRDLSENSPSRDTVSPTENIFKDFKNPNFVKELTDSISLFAKDESGKRKKVNEEEEKTDVNVRRQCSEDEVLYKASTSAEVVASLKKKSNSSESVVSVKSTDGKHTLMDVVKTHYEPTFININTPDVFPVAYESIHDGYENVKIIESVKKEFLQSVDSQPMEIEKKVEVTPEKETTEVDAVKKEVEIKPVEVVRRVKPAVSEKPKDLRKNGVPEFLKVSLNRIDPKSSSENEEKTEKVVPRTASTLVERRKSELMLLTELEEKDWKAKIRPLKKQTSFSETEKKNPETSLIKTPPPKEEENSQEKTEQIAEEVEEVVLRKKSVARTSDDQPELMKVFARRSLKVRESEKIVEDMQRSRDSDKENEVAEEDGKKVESEEKKELSSVTSKEGGSRLSARVSSELKASGTPIKPELASRKVVHRYGRSLSENNGQPKEEIDFKRETSILEDNKLNKIRNVEEITVSCHMEKGEKEKEEEETGFKRIQQRKAEWERRAQQGAK